MKRNDLALLSDAIAAAGKIARKRKQQEQRVRAKLVKNCPCHGSVCQEGETGGRVCQAGVCVRMN